jgi:hypothetical protein
MTITLTIPDDVAAQAQSGNAAQLSRRLLELGHRSNRALDRAEIP